MHKLVSIGDPVQFAPPGGGTGLLHSRVLVFLPCPQVAEQGPNMDHSLQPPSSIKFTEIEWFEINVKNRNPLGLKQDRDKNGTIA